MITLEISEEQLSKARKLYDFDALNGSITKGKSNIYGALGEVVCHDYFSQKFEASYESTKDYDLIVGGYKVDVKTKKTTVIPKPHYLSSVSCWNTRQECDFYFFVRIRESLKTAYMMGYMSPKEFYEVSTFRKKGEEDVNGWLFKDDCYNLELSKLHQFMSITVT